MQRVLIIGCCGAGKSTIARKLSAATGLDLLHLDKYYWKAGWEETNKAEWEGIVCALANKSSWIMDGNYGGTMDLRIDRADTIIFLDYRTSTCLWRITKRIIRYHGRTRPDMPPGCFERFDLAFYHYVATYNYSRRPAILSKLAQLDESKKVLIFKSDLESKRFLNSLSIPSTSQG